MSAQRRLPPAVRRPSPTLASLAFVVLAVVVVVVGLNAGAALAERPGGGVTHAVLTPLSEEPFTPVNTLPAQAVIRLEDGHLARFRSPGNYEDFSLDPAQAQAARDHLAHASDWADEYLLDGGMAEQRWTLQLLGANSRTIAIDNPLANRGLPESLFRVVLILLRPSLDENAAANEVVPKAMRLRLDPVPPGVEVPTDGIGALPEQVDPAKAASAEGQILSGPELDAFDAASQARSRLAVGQNGIIVRGEDQRLSGLFWGIDWSAWTVAPP